jgi:hypothetical protein
MEAARPIKKAATWMRLATGTQFGGNVVITTMLARKMECPAIDAASHHVADDFLRTEKRYTVIATARTSWQRNTTASGVR